MSVLSDAAVERGKRLEQAVNARGTSGPTRACDSESCGRSAAGTSRRARRSAPRLRGSHGSSGHDTCRRHARACVARRAGLRRVQHRESCRLVHAPLVHCPRAPSTAGRRHIRGATAESSIAPCPHGACDPATVKCSDTHDGTVRGQGQTAGGDGRRRTSVQGTSFVNRGGGFVVPRTRCGTVGGRVWAGCGWCVLKHTLEASSWRASDALLEEDSGQGQQRLRKRPHEPLRRPVRGLATPCTRVLAGRA